MLSHPIPKNLDQCLLHFLLLFPLQFYLQPPMDFLLQTCLPPVSASVTDLSFRVQVWLWVSTTRTFRGSAQSSWHGSCSGRLLFTFSSLSSLVLWLMHLHFPQISCSLSLPDFHPCWSLHVIFSFSLSTWLGFSFFLNTDITDFRESSPR